MVLTMNLVILMTSVIVEYVYEEVDNQGYEE